MNAYLKGKPFNLDTPQHVVFTPDELEMTHKSKTATAHVCSATESDGFIDIMDNMIRWRTQYELTGKAPDSKENLIIDPLAVFEDGSVAAFHWGSSHTIGMGRWSPYRAESYMGPRAAIR